MKIRQPNTMQQRTLRAFTLIELLVVIAIIAILAAILFPVFAAVRENARQSNTMSNMHSIYIGARMFYEDEGRYPSSLFGYAERIDNTIQPPYPPYRPITNTNPDILGVTPMDEAKAFFATNSTGSNPSTNRGFLYREQVKDYITFLNADNLTTNKKAVTNVYYPPAIAQLLFGSPYVLVTWQQESGGSGCTPHGDPDFPSEDATGMFYQDVPKYFYTMDSMDIGPMLGEDGKQLSIDGKPAYELHYSPDWTRQLGLVCDVDGGGKVVVNQLKYRNPPTDRTILTWSTHHVATAGSNSTIVLLLSGTARKIKYTQGLQQLPLYYR